MDDTIEAPPPSQHRGRGGRLLPPRRGSWRRRLTRPAVLDIRIGPLVSIYAWRLRHHALQELLAGAGIAIGVALVLGVLTASESITGSASQIVHDIAGTAQLQVTARSTEGFDERLVASIGKLPGVRVAAPLLRASGVLEGANRRHSIQIAGTTASQLALEGRATRYLGSEQLGQGVALTSSLAEEVGASTGSRVTILARGRAEALPVHAVWGSQQVSSIAEGPLLVAPLSVMQQALGLPHRVNQVLIAASPHDEAQVRAELQQLVGTHIDVQPATHEIAVLHLTAKPFTESSGIFAAIAAIVGFLFAINAMLLTVPERRRWVAEARTQGYSASQIVVILGFQALALGIVASAVGVLIGYGLAELLFRSLPEYLTLAFPIGNHPVIEPATVALAVGAGILATLIASAAPLRDLSPRRPIDAVLHGTGKVGHSVGARTTLGSGALGAAIVLLAILLAVVAPSLGIVAVVLLAVGAICAVPAQLAGVVSGLMPLAERMRGSMLAIALTEVEGTATRSIALASVAALALYGSVAVIGAREDLVAGLDAATVQYLDTADIWVSPVGNNPFLTDGFDGQAAERAIARVPAVAAVRVYQGGFLDLGSRRLWIRARPVADRELVQASQIVRGDQARATALMRTGAWAAVSSGFASEHHLGLGSSFALPSPTGDLRLRVAAITTNSGWPPGAITIVQPVYERFWQTKDPTALEVDLRHGVSPRSGLVAVKSALGSLPGLRAQTLAEREAQHRRDARQGVQSLSEISRLTLIAAALAIAFALTAAITARRTDLASRKAEGYEPAQLWRQLLLESAIVLGTGAFIGAVLGLLGHVFASTWLRHVRGFPAPFSVHLAELLLAVLIVAGVALAVVVLAGSIAVRVPPRINERD